MDPLLEIAELIRERSRVSREIAMRIGRPALFGHVGEYVASRIFEIALESRGNNRGFDGRFLHGPLTGRTVNVKWYGRQEGILDLRADGDCDLLLVMTGPHARDVAPDSPDRPWAIDHVYLFETGPLLASLRERSVKIGVATSVTRTAWEAAEIYPESRNRLLTLDPAQRSLLALFATPSDG